ncbi:MAG: hypothetical protein KBD63_01475 [Bacteriovoracaceae bacterium]|nr:hypothetical protein [Bacteriovoracaceae bacterium]
MPTLDLSLEELSKTIGYHFKSEFDLLQSIEELSQGFNFRKNLETYTQEERLVSAYTLFYLSTNVPKFEHSLNFLSLEYRHKILSNVFVDIGCGPGTYLLAHRSLQETSQKIKRIGVDRSPLMRQQAQRVYQHYFSTNDEVILSDHIPVDDYTSATFFFGHSANEMGPEKVLEMLQKHNPETIMFIEPGTPYEFQKMLSIRSALLSAGYQVIYPCLNSNHCPLKEQEDWCHQVVYHTHPPDVERICQKLKKDRRTLPLLLHVYSKQKETNIFDGILQRSEEVKPAFFLQVCDKENQIKHLEVLKRGMTSVDKKRYEKLCAGKRLHFKPLKEVGSKLRVELTIF